MWMKKTTLTMKMKRGKEIVIDLIGRVRRQRCSINRI
jgi:hypothetical protein